MALLSSVSVNAAGGAEAMVAASAGGDTMVPGPTAFLRVNNAGTGAVTVTVTRVLPCSDGVSTPTHDIVVSVPAGAVREIKVDSRYARPSDGLAAITYSGVTSVTVGAFSVS